MSAATASRGRNRTLRFLLDALEGAHLLSEAFGWRRRRPSAPVAPIESAVGGALRPISAPTAFREGLRSSLAVAAQHRQQGVTVEGRRPTREALLLTLSAATLALAVAVGVAVSLVRLRAGGH
jgi:hypothetical protein